MRGNLSKSPKQPTLVKREKKKETHLSVVLCTRIMEYRHEWKWKEWKKLTAFFELSKILFKVQVSNLYFSFCSIISIIMIEFEKTPITSYIIFKAFHICPILSGQTWWKENYNIKRYTVYIKKFRYLFFYTK